MGSTDYDGTSWRVFPFDEGIVGTRINTLYVARDGSVYVGSDSGDLSLRERDMGTGLSIIRGDYRWITYERDGSRGREFVGGY